MHFGTSTYWPTINGIHPTTDNPTKIAIQYLRATHQVNNLDFDSVLTKSRVSVIFITGDCLSRISIYVSLMVRRKCPGGCWVF